MNEINIILDSNIELDDSLITIKNDKKILFNKINTTLNLLNLDSSLKNNDNLIDYKLLDLIYIDDFVEFLEELELNQSNKQDNLENNTNFSKKTIIKKILDFYNPIIDENNRINPILKLDKKKIIIDKNQITLNYIINSKYINKKLSTLDLKNYIIPALNHFTILGVYNDKLHFNIPYKLNDISLELNNLFNKISKFNTNIFIKSFKHLNKALFSLESVNINDLVTLYKYILIQFKLYTNNKELLYNTRNSLNTVDFNKDLIKDNEDFILYFNKNKREKKNIDIDKCNLFLTHKIGNYFSNNIYNSFNNDDLLHLYENIYIYSLDNEKIQNIIKNIMKQKQFQKEYQKNLLILENKILINNQLEYIAKKKFPNLFNVNSPENLFNKFNKFDINKIPKKFKEVIILDLKKNEDYIKNQIYNKCTHKNVLKSFYSSINKYQSFHELLKFIKKDNIKDNNIYKCNICSYNLICPHIVDYYILFFNKNIQNKNDDYVHLKILNKYMSKAPIDMIYYCRICGEELGKSYDIEQNIEFKDNIRQNTLEYSDDTSVMIQNTISYIVYTYISFKDINIKINKQQIINYIIDNISLYINNIEKKLRKSKNYDNEKVTNLINFNIIVFTYACIIFIMNKYTNLVFNKINKSKKFDNIIVQKETKVASGSKKKLKKINGGKSMSKSMNNIKENFREAYDLIINTNYLLLSKLDYNKNSEIIKNILVKSYTFINNSNELELDTKKINNLEIIFNSSIYKYYFNVKNIYPITKDNNNKRKNISYMLNFSDMYKSTLKKVKYDDHINILGKIDVDKKPNYLFENIDIPLFSNFTKLENIESMTKINSYSEYKYYSFLLFVYFIKNRIYELPIYEFIDLGNDIKNLENIYIDKIKTNIIDEFDKYKNIMYIYIEKSLLLKQYEQKLIQNNIDYNQYPYSNIKLNNSRYYYHKETKLNKYICKIDGKLHTYTLYIYKLEDKEYIINKKEIEKNRNIINNKKTKFIDYQCSKCKLRKNSINSEYDNKDVLKIINEKNDITIFYNIYRYKCPLNDFHMFEKNICKICKMSSDDILSKNISIFNKFKQNYKDYLSSITSIQNNKITDMSIKNKKLLNLNILDNYKISISSNTKNITEFIIKIDKINIEELFIFISTLSKIDIKYFKILGLTEGLNYSEIELIEPSYDKIDNRFIKISNYIRTLSIYSNLLVNLDKITNYYDYDFLEIINSIKLLDISKQIKLNNDINLLNIFNFIKMTKNDNKYIIEFGLKILFNKIKDISILNKNLDNKLNSYVEFIINRIFKYDELFTNFNYAELKQMFTENAPNFINYDIDEIDNDGNDELEVDDLFSYSNVDIEFGDVED
jgi:hypothetical protein